ncbi:MAG: hypothetical protein ACRYF3_12900, partial [Janthinobacterium lividum]
MLFDVDGTLIDVLENKRSVWRDWPRHHGLDPAEVQQVALRTRPQDTFTPQADPAQCLACCTACKTRSPE